MKNLRGKTVVIDPLVGRTLNQYRIEAVVGRGGMGVVYRALDLKLRRSVALKLLPTHLTSDQERRKRFILEARSAARVSHPAIAQIYDVDEDGGTFFIAMELVEGKAVCDLIRNRELDLLGAIDIAIQVGAGLARAHAAGIVHRDIKPANVIQTPDGHVKILDFGLAKLLGGNAPSDTSAGTAHDLTTMTQTQLGTIKGTPAYMSPEQVNGENIDARSDLFSLGVMLFEMATGEVPFRRPTPFETMHAIGHDEAPAMNTIRPNLPPGLQRIVTKCLKKRAEQRYPDAQTLIEELQVLRRETESGLVRSPSLRERIGDTFDRLAHLRASEYMWMVGGVLAVAGLIYLLSANQGILFPLIPFAFIGLLIYRNIRHQPRKLLDSFVRKVAKIPEVRFIACEDRKITVGVDRPVAQLYGRINKQLNYCNRKLFFGQPMSVAIRHDLTVDETRQLMAGAGVRYVRDDAVQASEPPAVRSGNHEIGTGDARH